MLVSAAPTRLPLLFFYYLTLVLFSPPCPLLHISFYLNLSDRSGRNRLLSLVLSGYDGSPDTRFSQRTTRLISWPDGEHYSWPLQSFVVSLLLSLVSTLIFSRTGGVPSHRNSSKCRLPRFPPRTPSSCSLYSLSSTLQWLFAMPPSLGRGRVNNNNNKLLFQNNRKLFRRYYKQMAECCIRLPQMRVSSIASTGALIKRSRGYLWYRSRIFLGDPELMLIVGARPRLFSQRPWPAITNNETSNTI